MISKAFFVFCRISSHPLSQRSNLKQFLRLNHWVVAIFRLGFLQFLKKMLKFENLNSITGLNQEIILILSGHHSSLSSLLLPSGESSSSKLDLNYQDPNNQNQSEPNQKKEEFLKQFIDPINLNRLKKIITIANYYKEISNYIDSIKTSNSNSSILISILIQNLQNQLNNYQTHLIDIEFKILNHHSSFIFQNKLKSPSTSISSILAEIQIWEFKFLHLIQFLKSFDQLQNQNHQSLSNSNLIQFIYNHSLTGSPLLFQFFENLQNALEKNWLDQFRSIIIFGHPPDHFEGDLFFFIQSNQSQTHLSINFILKSNPLPNLPCLNPINQIENNLKKIFKSISILHHLIQFNNHSSTSNPNHQKILIPPTLQSQLSPQLSNIDNLSHPAFRLAIEKIQEILSNYLFTNYLTPQIVISTLKNLINIFLFAHSTFSNNLVQGFVNLKTKHFHFNNNLLALNLNNSSNLSKSFNLNDRQLDIILLKASINADSGLHIDQQLKLDGFKFSFISTHQQQISASFSDMILSKSHPILLSFNPPPGLSIFLTSETCVNYSAIHSYLFTFLIARYQLQDSWRYLTHRQRFKSNSFSTQSSSQFIQTCFEALRRFTWWTNLMINHSWQDVINPSLCILNNLNQSSSSQALFKIHDKFLFFIIIGLGLNSNQSINSIKKLIEIVFELLNQFESWAFDLLPNLLETDLIDNQAHLLDHRHQIIKNLIHQFDTNLSDFLISLRDGFGDENFQSEDSRTKFVELKEFWLEGFIFRKKSVDALTLRLNFNQWFPLNHHHQP
ncbi:hypothetical protein O181_010230 [Austropuccinia psidii MF-1]|uniref:Spindle pole body component n=1 Tax=Austropuccinia psidii MF-1 TaxID=1389203 RepID=A0A9Q3GKP1_9BASI|nr:hypothetical protein [Austropuccinia psidii MF-1]